MKQNNIPICEHHRKLAPVTNVQLLQDGLAPADYLLLACRALKVLWRKWVVTSHTQNLPHVGVDATGGQLMVFASWLRADEPQLPQLSWQPHQQGPGKVAADLRQLVTDQWRLRRVPPKFCHFGSVKLHLACACWDRKKLPRHPLVVSSRQCLLPSLRQNELLSMAWKVFFQKKNMTSYYFHDSMSYAERKLAENCVYSNQTAAPTRYSYQ